MVARGHSQSHKPVKKGKSKGRSTKNECTFCCLKLQKNYKGKAIFYACVVEHDAMELDSNKWIVHSGYTLSYMS